MTTGPFQVMPDLTPDEYETLKADIAAHGVLVPITVDQHGRILDGHHRQAIATELKLPYDRLVRYCADDNEARTIALKLNLARRHLTRAQKQALILNEIEFRPDDSDRAIARRLGCSPSTVGAIRRPVSNLDTPPLMTREEAEEATEEIRDKLTESDRAILMALLRGVPPAEVAVQLVATQRDFEKIHGRTDKELVDAVRELVYSPRIDNVLAWPHGGWYAEAAASQPDELRDILLAQRQAGRLS